MAVRTTCEGGELEVNPDMGVFVNMRGVLEVRPVPII
jgi:hypothetical protein